MYYADIRSSVLNCRKPAQERTLSEPTSSLLPADIQIAPNPATDHLVLSSSAEGRVLMHSIEGRVVLESAINAGDNTLRFSLAPGLYFLQCRLSDGRTATHKIVIQ